MRISDWISDVCSSDLILCFDQHPAIIEGHHAAWYMHAAAQADTFRLLQFHRLESLLPAEIKDAMIVRPLIKDGNISPLFLRHRFQERNWEVIRIDRKGFVRGKRV